jgi:hypothetical protein
VQCTVQPQTAGMSCRPGTCLQQAERRSVSHTCASGSQVSAGSAVAGLRAAAGRSAVALCRAGRSRCSAHCSRCSGPQGWPAVIPEGVPPDFLLLATPAAMAAAFTVAAVSCGTLQTGVCPCGEHAQFRPCRTPRSCPRRRLPVAQRSSMCRSPAGPCCMPAKPLRG